MVYMTQTISTIVDASIWGNIWQVYMTQTISTIVDLFARFAVAGLVYMTQTISTIVDRIRIPIPDLRQDDPNNFYYWRFRSS